MVWKETGHTHMSPSCLQNLWSVFASKSSPVTLALPNSAMDQHAFNAFTAALLPKIMWKILNKFMWSGINGPHLWGPCYAEGHSPLALATGGVRPVPPTPAETEIRGYPGPPHKNWEKRCQNLHSCLKIVEGKRCVFQCSWIFCVWNWIWI